MAINESARIYNLFPRLVGAIPNWVRHFPRISAMRFNWIFLNPFQYPGFSGSLYSIKDYYRLNPLFFDENKEQSEPEQLKWMVDEAHKTGLKVMMDLVVNHTSVDHPFTVEHKDWYKWEKNNGQTVIKNPGAMDGDNWVSWGDLAEIDNESSSDKDNLWNYWLDMVHFYLDMGFDGFRCDAAYKLPGEFWEFLIGKSIERFPNVIWFAESLGCPPEDTIALGKSGFQYTFNSSKWWDYKEKWCYDQYTQNAPYSMSISFPESHDTPRCFEEANENVPAVKHKYLFSALFSSGVMIPIGFEYGFKKRINVVQTLPSDFEEIHHDFSDYIKNVNTLKAKYRIFNEESTLELLDVLDNDNIAILLKTSLNQKERCLLILNKNMNGQEEVFVTDHLVALASDKQAKDISLENPLTDLYKTEKIALEAGEIKIFYSVMSD